MAVLSLFLSNLFLLAVANALLVSSSRPNGSNNALLTSLGAGGEIRRSNIWNNWSQISRGGGVRNRKSVLRRQQQQQQLQGWQQQNMFSAASDSEDPAAYEYIPKVFPKEDEEMLFIKEVLKANFLFQDFSDENNEENLDLSVVIASFEKFTYNEGTMLCKQGDTEDTDYLYLIVSGSCSVSIDGKLLPDPYGTMRSGSLIGDLAMMDGTARAATVCTETPLTVFRLHRTDFYHFLDYADVDRNDSDKSDADSSSPASRTEKIQQQVEEIDEILDQISGVKSKYLGDIIRPFQPERRWLWSRWKGTILQHAWKSAVSNMVVSFLFLTAVRIASDHILKSPVTWPVGEYTLNGGTCGTRYIVQSNIEHNTMLH